MARRSRASRNTYGEPRRIGFPEDEARLGWLPMLLDAYYESDKSVYQSIAKALTKRGRRLACAKGCSSCCKTHVTIPVYPLELLGLYWFALEKMGEKNRIALVDQLLSFRPGSGCPFLISGICGVHPVRPMACRFFNVFNTRCREGEDPFYTRRQDVLTPDGKEKNKALSCMLPYHGFSQRAERREAMRNGTIHRYAKNLQNINWPKVALSLGRGDKAPLR